MRCFSLSSILVFKLCSQSTSSILPPWHSQTGKYDQHPLWLPLPPDRTDRRRQWRRLCTKLPVMSSKPSVAGKPWWKNLQILKTTTDRQWHTTDKFPPRYPLTQREISQNPQWWVQVRERLFKCSAFKMFLCDTNQSCLMYLQNMQRNRKLFISNT